MTAPPSLPTPGVRGPLLERFLQKTLTVQLYWVWSIGLSLVILLTSGGWVTYHLIINSRMYATAEIAISDMVQGMHQFLDLDLQKRDNHLQEASHLAEQKGPAAAKFADTTILWADGQVDPRGSPLSPSQLKAANAALAEHQRQDTGEMRLSEPVQIQQTGDWAIQLSRRINTEGGRLPEGGRFQGIVLSYWTSAQIEAYFRETFFLPGGKSLLLRQDGRVLVDASSAGVGYGASVALAPMLKQPANGECNNDRGSYFGTLTGIDDTPRLYLLQKLAHYPLYVLKGTTAESIANIARPGILVMAGLMLLVNGVILIATGGLHLYVRQVNATINERQASETALRHNQERLNFALVGSDSGEWEMELPEANLYVSQRLVDLIGPPWAEGVYAVAQWQALVHPDDQPILITALHRILTHMNEGQGVMIRARDSSVEGYRWMSIKGRIRQQDASGQVKSVTGLATDVTEQQITQSIVQDRTAQLDAIFNLSPDAFVTFDHHHKVKFVNPAFVQMTGWADESIKGMSEAQFSRRLGLLCIAQRPFGSIAAMRATVLARGSCFGELIELNGVPQRILKVSLQLSDAPTVSQILHLRDVTHETIVEGMKTEFLATAAHELRTPMASIVGFAEVLCTHPLQQLEQMEFAQIIWRQSLHLAGILDELLDLSRIEARGGKGLLMVTLDLRAELEETIKAFPLPEGREAPAVDLPRLICKADRGKAQQVIENVISNAYKFSGPGTAVTITRAKPAVHPVSGRHLVGLVVRDAGIGMTSEQVGRVFDRFYRVDKTGAIPGNGLGLSISRELMQLMGGQINIDSAPGQGTTATVLFEQADPSQTPTHVTTA